MAWKSWSLTTVKNPVVPTMLAVGLFSKDEKVHPVKDTQ